MSFRPIEKRGDFKNCRRKLLKEILFEDTSDKISIYSCV